MSAYLWRPIRGAMGFVEELQWRGMVQDVVPGTDELLAKGSTPGYIGFDPTADSLHVGNLVPIMLLVHFQQAGHKPIALVGGATGMVGDPSGKKEERQLLTEEVIRHNVAGIKKQLEHFLDFDHPTTGAEVVNNLDWFKDMGFLQFIRDVGKHISVNYMMAKDSVKNRLEDGISFTEFSYQLVQGYDFYWLHQNKGCRLQMGGSDQWGNITTGTELIRRMGAGEAFALTCPLLTKQDGSKFGKSEAGNVWLDPERTSAYKFYQFWLNASDEDASKLVRYFTTWDHEKIVALENEHAAKPHERALQKALAKDITKRVHGEAELNSALQASEILFGKSNAAALTALSVKQLKEVFEGVPQASIARSDLQFGIDIIDLLSVQTDLLRSKGEARRALREGSISVNRNKVTEDRRVGLEDLLSERFILLQRGKKNYFLVEVE